MVLDILLDGIPVSATKRDLSIFRLLTSRFLDAFGNPPIFADNLHKSASTWNATGELEFLNDWSVYLCLSIQWSV